MPLNEQTKPHTYDVASSFEKYVNLLLFFHHLSFFFFTDSRDFIPFSITSSPLFAIISHFCVILLSAFSSSYALFWLFLLFSLFFFSLSIFRFCFCFFGFIKLPNLYLISTPFMIDCSSHFNKSQLITSVELLPTLFTQTHKISFLRGWATCCLSKNTNSFGFLRRSESQN